MPQYSGAYLKINCEKELNNFSDFYANFPLLVCDTPEITSSNKTLRSRFCEWFTLKRRRKKFIVLRDNFLLCLIVVTHLFASSSTASTFNTISQPIIAQSPNLNQSYNNVFKDTKLNHSMNTSSIIEIMQANPLLRTLDMFQTKEPVVNINGSNESGDKNDDKKRRNPFPKFHNRLHGGKNRQFDGALGAKLMSDANFVKAYNSLAHVLTPSTVDNFDEIYQLFNSTYFGMALKDSALQNDWKHPYPPLPVKSPTQFTISTTTTQASRLSTVASVSPASSTFKLFIPRPRAKTMKEFFDSIVFERKRKRSEKRDRSSSAPSEEELLQNSDRFSRRYSQRILPKVLEGGEARHSFSEDNDDRDVVSLPFDVTPSLELALSTAASEYFDVPSGSTMPSTIIVTDTTTITTTTSRSPRTTSVYYAAHDEDQLLQPSTTTSDESLVLMPQEFDESITASTGPLNPWERKRGDGYAATAIVEQAESSDGSMSRDGAPKFVGNSGEALMPMNSGDAASSGHWDESAGLSQSKFSAATVVANGETEANNFARIITDAVNEEIKTQQLNHHHTPGKAGRDDGRIDHTQQQLSTLQPFPPVMPGGQFYVDQHISYGQFGRAVSNTSDAASSIAYDPNVLGSRYGFSGMLSGTMPSEFIVADSEKAGGNNGGMGNNPTVSAKRRPPPSLRIDHPFALRKRLNQKPTVPVFGVQNVPIPENDEREHRQFLANFPMLRNGYLSNAAYFYIPAPVKLSMARAIKLRVHGDPSRLISDNDNVETDSANSSPIQTTNHSFSANIPSLNRMFLNADKTTSSVVDRSLTSAASSTLPPRSTTLIHMMTTPIFSATTMAPNEHTITPVTLFRIESMHSMAPPSPPRNRLSGTTAGNLFSGGNSGSLNFVRFPIAGNQLNWSPTRKETNNDGRESRSDAILGELSASSLSSSESEVLGRDRSKSHSDPSQPASHRHTAAPLPLFPLPDLVQPLHNSSDFHHIQVEESSVEETKDTNLKHRNSSKKVGELEIEEYDNFDPVAIPPCYASAEHDEAKHYRDLPAHLISAVRRCFRRVKSCVFRNAKPLERRINFSEEECLHFCGERSHCASAIYSRSLAVCDIFNTRNGSDFRGNDATVSTADRLYRHKDYNYYEARRRAGDASVVNCWRENDPPQQQSVGENDSSPPGFLISSSLNGVPDGDETKHKDTISIEKTPKDVCPGDKDIIVFKSTGYRLLNLEQDLPGLSLVEINSLNHGSLHLSTTKAAGRPLEQISSETECIFSCLINLARGQTPYECMSATYNFLHGRCLLYSTGNNLNGNIHLIPDPEHNHYEKGCISLELVELCKGYPIIRHAQKTLLGFAIVSKFAATFVECIEMCFADRQMARQRNAGELRNRRYCKSVVYFYEETSSNNCILNSENKESKPAFFVDENESLVDYASFESCYDVHDYDELNTSGGGGSGGLADSSASFEPTLPNESGPTDGRRRAQPLTMYTVDSDRGATPLRRPTVRSRDGYYSVATAPDADSSQQIPPVAMAPPLSESDTDALSGESAETVIGWMMPPPHAFAPPSTSLRVKGSGTSNDEINLSMEERRRRIDMRRVLRRSIHRLERSD